MSDFESIIAKMSLKEKISYCTGADFWHTKSIEKLGVPAIKMSDGPHGLRCQGEDADMLGINDSLPATCFPTAVTAGATWNKELYLEEGRAIAREAVEAGVSVLLGPGCNIKRDPLGGRNFEYISEDPYLSGHMAAGFIKGVQSEGVSACVKHFAVNNQEYRRQSSDSIVDERTLREIYLRSFEIAVREGCPDAVMCSYNKINGVYASDNEWLLDTVLRKEWGFKGAVITDWGAMNDRIAAFKAGCDLNMPGGSKYMHRAAERAVNYGELDENSIDKSVRRILSLAKKGVERGGERFDREAHHSLARLIAEQGAVLLKNLGALPLKDGDAVIIGRMAAEPRYQGSGSSHINPTKLVSLTEAMQNISYLPCGDALGHIGETELADAVRAASEHSVVIVALGLPEICESEAFDREDMRLPEGYDRLVEAVSEVNSNTVVLLFCGGAVELPWADKVNAILYMGLPGQAGGEAAANLIAGKANPSGRLTESWTVRYGDTVTSETFGKTEVEYREGIYVGYRYYDKAELEVRYPFGHGLSYTRFEYTDLSVEGNEVSFLLKNTGGSRGAEVAQLYISFSDGKGYRAKKELCGFERIELEAGEERRVRITLDDRCFAFWQNGWRIADGDYVISVGASSRDIRLSTVIYREGEPCDDSDRLDVWYSSPKGIPSRSDWQKMSGLSSKPETKLRKRDYTLSSTIGEMREGSLFIKLVYGIIELVMRKRAGGKSGINDPTYRMMMAAVTECPIRSMEICSGGRLSGAAARFIVSLARLI